MVRLPLNLNETSRKNNNNKTVHTPTEHWADTTTKRTGSFLKFMLVICQGFGSVRYSGQLFTFSFPNATFLLSDKYFNSVIDVNVGLGKAWVGSYHQPHSWRWELKIIFKVFSLYISTSPAYREMLMKRNGWNWIHYFHDIMKHSNFCVTKVVEDF